MKHGVKNWVLHVAVNAGKARHIEDKLKRQSKSRGRILPSDRVYAGLWKFIKETTSLGYEIDIRCTDTNTTSNSVLLVGSKGDLFTEGYAHKGKVKLFRSDEGRPDLINELWPHIDRFGHARRYLNWNPWFFDQASLEAICYEVPLPQPKKAVEVKSSLVEGEAKCRVNNVKELERLLKQNRFRCKGTFLQRDEYYDTGDKILSTLDFNIRTRYGVRSVSMTCQENQPDTFKRVLSKFETIGALAYASTYDIEQVEGIGPKIAQAIYWALH